MKALVIQERDRRFLRELAVLRVADREQAKVVAGFGSTTRANARLLALTRGGLLRRFFLGTTAGGRKALYALTPKAATLVGVPLRGLRRRKDEAVATDFFVEHQLHINRLYCSLKFKPIPVQGIHFADWKTFEKPLTEDLRLIPDGYVELTAPGAPLAAFIEVDLGHESKKVWREKIERYLRFALSGAYEREFGKSRFRVLVIANSERRLRSIRSVAAPLTEKLFWFATLPDIDANGFFGAIWLRPRSDTKEAFITVP
jgi:hypothetical protein